MAEKMIRFQPIRPEELLMRSRQVKIRLPAFKKLNELVRIIQQNGHPVRRIDILSEIIKKTEVRRRGKNRLSLEIDPPLLRL